MPAGMVGRADETSWLLTAAADAENGRQTTLLLGGEAGIGKTSLVRAATDQVADRLEVIWAACLPLASLAVPLLPLRTAVRDADLGTGGDALLRFDAWLDRSAARRPVLLVVDDLQWADQSTLDVVMYIIAGREGRRLAIVLTMRTGDRLAGWLADVRRLPRVGEVVLGHLDRADTSEQIAGLFGRPPDEGLVDAVYARTRGNPYLTRLLVRDLDPRAAALPAGMPTQLRDGLTRAWRGLPGPAQQLTQVLSVAGRPQLAGQIEPMSAGPAVPLLRAAVDAGVLVIDVAHRYWFAHPLLAEILYEDLLPEERRALHVAFAEALAGSPERDTAVELADHYDRAGLTEPAYEWALRAAEATDGPAERVRLLRRALRLSESMPDPDARRTDLWQRLRIAAETAGLQDDEFGAVETLLTLVDDPAVRARLHLRRAALRASLGTEADDAGDRWAAMTLTAAAPQSVDHALACAGLALYLLMVRGDRTGLILADKAMAVASASGSDLAVANALISQSYALSHRARPGAHRAALRAWAIALRTGDLATVKTAVYVAANSYDGDATDGTARIYHRAVEDFTRLGAPHLHISEMCAWEAAQLLELGRWRECLDRLRMALGARPGRRADAVARLVAAQLAVWQGRQAEAEAHLARAEEILPGGSDRYLDFSVVRALVAFGAGDTERALSVTLAGLGHDAGDEAGIDMLPLAARALADQAQACRDSGRDPAQVLARLIRLRQRHPFVLAPLTAAAQDLRARALQKVTEAETARAWQSSAEFESWRRAADACQAIDGLWEETYCRWRQAQAALRDRTTRRDAVEPLRHAHHLATELAAHPLTEQVERLAQAARIPLADPILHDLPKEGGLTTREREILGHVLAGRTYAEIAAALVISQKTVGVHISNMLRKTGAANRVELAEWANRIS
ncbi:LuxR C-terminal-related transcriptional regulator [Actinoplanes sp. CA-142083]|uniref:helix-turn-helix transcriptional regulator n=1 Tax=Actinoplanes sp. CA-142083 TaxID=3239903 RepID=UPI003D907A82